MKFKGQISVDNSYDGTETSMYIMQKQDNIDYQVKLDLYDVLRKLDGKIIEIEIKVVK